MLLACCAAGGYPEQLDAGGAVLEGTKSPLCQESCCMCWRQMTSSVCLRAALASYLSCEKDASNERCFLHLVMAFSEMLLWDWNFVCSVLHRGGAHACPGAVGRQHRERGCFRGLGGLYQAQQVAEGKQEVSLAILWAAAVSALIDVKDGCTHTKRVYKAVQNHGWES